jgi:disulfide bond formation protein DsbB
MIFKHRLYQPWVSILTACECFIILSLLIAAFILQWRFHELPCPLCWLQRVGLLLVVLPLLMNLRVRRRILHTMLSQLAAILTGVMACRQVLLHINGPLGSGYGDLMWGFHLYTWMAIFCLGIAIYHSIVACLIERFPEKPLYRQGQWGKYCVNALIVLFFLVTMSSLLGVWLECGFSACPDNPVHYLHRI